ncbi:MAG TPA: hypothetical protein VNK26_04455 [Pyrinomonadaceae bacterium]|nr:hypothetical protein [Pyrinomonadaceae bacterium]
MIKRYQRFATIFTILLAFLYICQTGLTSAFAQSASPTPEQINKSESQPKQPKPADSEKKKDQPSKDQPSQEFTAEQLAESVILIYGYPVGRQILDQVRKTTAERGQSKITNPDGTVSNVNYSRWIIRGADTAKDKIRLDQEFPSTRYSLIQNNGKTKMIIGDYQYDPREDVARAFHDQIYHSLDALLRYKEDGSTLSLAGKDKILGVEFYLLDVKNKEGETTRFYVSVKRFRVMMLSYESGGKKYTRKFYDYNYAQGTLVPFRTVLYEGDKVIEESEIGTITFGQDVDEGLFPAIG